MPKLIEQKSRSIKNPLLRFSLIAGQNGSSYCGTLRHNCEPSRLGVLFAHTSLTRFKTTILPIFLFATQDRINALWLLRTIASTQCVFRDIATML
jgi:hypothetical protein